MEENKENMILEYVSDQIKIQPNPEKLNAFLKNDCLFISEKESRNKILFLFEEKEPTSDEIKESRKILV